MGKKSKQRQPCEFCGGSGQLSFFKGASRFLLSVEECSACNGTGLGPDPAGAETAGSDRKKKKGGKSAQSNGPGSKSFGPALSTAESNMKMGKRR